MDILSLSSGVEEKPEGRCSSIHASVALVILKASSASHAGTGTIVRENEPDASHEYTGWSIGGEGSVSRVAGIRGHAPWYLKEADLRQVR